jgi:hypothetical protein
MTPTPASLLKTSINLNGIYWILNHSEKGKMNMLEHAELTTDNKQLNWTELTTNDWQLVVLEIVLEIGYDNLILAILEKLKDFWMVEMRNLIKQCTKDRVNYKIYRRYCSVCSLYQFWTFWNYWTFWTFSCTVTMQHFTFSWTQKMCRTSNTRECEKTLNFHEHETCAKVLNVPKFELCRNLNCEPFMNTKKC